MLFSYENIINKYKLNIKNILHVGAHLAEESASYFLNGASKVIWIEANNILCEKIKNNLDSKNIILNYLVSDKDDEELVFNITNNSEASSFLELEKCKTLYPNIIVQNKINIKSKTLQSIFKENNLLFSDIDFINLDIQGAELLALKGIGDNFKSIKAIYTEINTDYVYKKCALVDEIDDYLRNYNFKRVETVLNIDGAWGDALYVKV